jgi:hypothetical protein
VELEDSQLMWGVGKFLARRIFGGKDGCGTGKRLMLGTSGGVGRFATDVGCGEVFGSSDFWRERNGSKN